MSTVFKSLDPLFCIERLTLELSELRPFVMVRRNVDGINKSIVPVWLELIEKPLPEREYIRLAMGPAVVLPKYQTLANYLELPIASTGYKKITHTRKAVSFTARNWLKEAPADGPEGDFIIFAGTYHGHSFWGTYADSQEAARKFIAEHEGQVCQ